ncbi:MAG: ATP-dependent DNA helicase, partial [Gammaproteobacteria bacterium]
LDRAVFDAGRSAAPHALKSALDRVSRAWNSAIQAQSETYRVYDSLPAPLLAALDKYISRVTEYLSVDKLELDEPAQTFFFEGLRFCRLAAELDDDTLFEITAPDAPAAADGSIPYSVLCLRNIVPRRFLAPRFAAAHATVLFSATLAPHAFYRDILGLPEAVAWLDVRSPFHPDQLSVKLVRTISTRYLDRERSLVPIADLVARQFEAQPGNYLAFFSSFDYLNRVAALVEARHPGIPIWTQSRGMPEADRTAYLARFCEGGQGVGFAVLGGVFAEGIDLPGSRLIGAFIATLGLPQINAVNEQTQRRMHAMFGAGYEYTYLYPGLQKVVQAAGRVIRATSDRGVLYLIDDRFERPEINRLLPTWWKLDR